MVRATVASLGLTPTHGLRVRLTGEVVMGDEEFASVFGGAIVENMLSLLRSRCCCGSACARRG